MSLPIKHPITVDVPQLSPERRLLWEAANVIEREGWWSASAPSGGLCVLGAIGRVSKCEDEKWRAVDMMCGHVGVRNGTALFREWNDIPGQTAEAVVKALRDCAVSS